MRYLLTGPSPADGRFLLLRQDWEGAAPPEAVAMQENAFTPKQLKLEAEHKRQARRPRLV